MENISFYFSKAVPVLAPLVFLALSTFSEVVRSADLKSLFNSDGQPSKQQYAELGRLQKLYQDELYKSQKEQLRYQNKLSDILEDPAVPITAGDIKEGVKLHDEQKKYVIQYVDNLIEFSQRNVRLICHESAFKFKSYVDVIDSNWLSKLRNAPLNNVQNRIIASGIVSTFSGFQAEMPDDGSVDTMIGSVLKDLVLVCVGSKSKRIDLIDRYVESAKNN